jgi:predicted ABC-type ATPase
LASLFIIAGPNGAGKSTNSKTILANDGITAFDYDLELHTTWSTFSFDPAVEDGVRNSVSERFLSLKEEALISKTDFAYETNYHHPSQFDLIEQFKRSGHTTSLEQLDNTFQRFDVVRIFLSGENENSHMYTLLPSFNLAQQFEELSVDLKKCLPKLEEFIDAFSR